MKRKIKAGRQTAFSYKAGNSIIHLCPAWVKIILLPFISILFFKLPPLAAGLMLGFIILVQLLLKFSPGEIFSDVKLILYYAVVLLIFRGKEVIPMLIRLLCMLELTALLFRTSSGLQLREGFEKIELAFRKLFHLKKKTPLAQSLSLFVCFIPLVAKNWEEAKRAWFARGGKASIKMLLVLLPVFFSIGMKQAWNMARAIAVRQSNPSLM